MRIFTVILVWILLLALAAVFSWSTFYILEPDWMVSRLFVLLVCGVEVLTFIVVAFLLMIYILEL